MNPDRIGAPVFCAVPIAWATLLLFSPADDASDLGIALRKGRDPKAPLDASIDRRTRSGELEKVLIRHGQDASPARTPTKKP